MTNYQNEAEKYLAKIKAMTNKKVLVEYAQELIAQFQGFNGTIDKKRVSFEIANKDDLKILKKLIKFAYNIRYACDNDEKILSFNEVGDEPNIKTIVAKYRHKNKDIILATFRLVKEDIEIFKFFTFNDNKKEWPCKTKGIVPYELERMAFHPIFDFNKNRELQLFLVKGMFKKAMSLINEKEYWLVGTMRPGVKAFIDEAGVKNRKIDWLKFADNEHTRYVSHNWPKYFDQQINAYEIIS